MNESEKRPTHDNGHPGWPERHVNLIIGLLVLGCAATLVADFALRPFFNEHHPAHFGLENVFGYQAVLGFVAFVTVVLLGKMLRVVVRRPEDYYDR